MGADGLLKDPSGTTVTTKPSNDYRYPGTDSVINNDIQKQIDEENVKRGKRKENKRPGRKEKQPLLNQRHYKRKKLKMKNRMPLLPDLHLSLHW